MAAAYDFDFSRKLTARHKTEASTLPAFSHQFKYTLALNNGNHGSIDDVVVSVTVRAPPGIFLRDLVALKSVE